MICRSVAAAAATEASVSLARPGTAASAAPLHLVAAHCSSRRYIVPTAVPGAGRGWRTYATKRRPFAEMEAERTPFRAADYQVTKTAAPKWAPGDGAVSTEQHVRAADFEASRSKVALDPEELGAGDNYKLLVNGIVPRPIAFVSSEDSTGRRNLAPYSYFGAAGHNPPCIMISMNAKSKDDSKDSCANILATKRFVVNIISEPFAEAANYTSIDAPHDVSEWALSGLTPQPPFSWGGQGPPRVGESAFVVECELQDKLDIRNDDGDVTTTIIVGRIRCYVLNEGLRDADGSIAPGSLLPVSRGGGITYLRSTSGFDIPRPRWAKEAERPEVQHRMEAGQEAKR